MLPTRRHMEGVRSTYNAQTQKMSSSNGRPTLSMNTVKSVNPTRPGQLPVFFFAFRLRWVDKCFHFCNGGGACWSSRPRLPLSVVRVHRIHQADEAYQTPDADLVLIGGGLWDALNGGGDLDGETWAFGSVSRLSFVVTPNRSPAHRRCCAPFCPLCLCNKGSRFAFFSLLYFVLCSSNFRRRHAPPSPPFVPPMSCFGRRTAVVYAF